MRPGLVLSLFIASIVYPDYGFSPPLMFLYTYILHTARAEGDRLTLQSGGVSMAALKGGGRAQEDNRGPSLDCAMKDHIHCRLRFSLNCSLGFQVCELERVT